MQSGTLGERQTNKSPTFVHVTHCQSSVPCIRKFGFLTAQMTLLKSRDYLQSIILKNGKKLIENQHEKAVPYLENGLHLIKNKLGTSISLFLVAKAYLTWQVLWRIPGQKVIFHFYLSLLQDWNPTQQTILQLLFATFQQPEI